MARGVLVAVAAPPDNRMGPGEKAPVGHSNLLDRRPIRVIYPGGPGRRREWDGQRLAARPLVIAAPAVVVLQGSSSTTAPPSFPVARSRLDGAAPETKAGACRRYA